MTSEATRTPGRLTPVADRPGPTPGPADRAIAPHRPTPAGIETPNGTFEFAPQLLRVRDAQRRRSRARAPRRAGSILGGARARAPVRGLGGRHPRRDPVHDPRRGHGLGPGRRGRLGRHGPDGRRLPQAGHGRAADPGRGLDHPTPAGGSSTRPVTSSMRRPASCSRPRPASTSRPARTQKRALRDRYAYRATEAPETGAAAAVEPARPTRWTATVIETPVRERGDGPRRRVRRRPPRRRGGARHGPGRVHERPGGFAAALTKGLAALADPGVPRRPAADRPGHRRGHGVRWPLMAAVQRGFRNATRGVRPTPLLFIADRLFHETELEARWFAFGLLERTLDVETERTWQLLRRAAREAGDWITVDSLAHPYAKGIAAEPYRWAELELLVVQPVPLGAPPRRLDDRDDDPRRPAPRPRPAGRRPRPAAAGNLMGDAEPDVQKALAWAYRSLTVVDRAATERPFATRRSARPAMTTATAPGSSGTRLPSSIPRRPPSCAADWPASASAPARRRPRAAAETAARFGGLPDPPATRSRPC